MASAHSVWFRFAGFAASVRRRSHGRVLRVPAGFLFQLRDPSDHHIVRFFERRDLLAQRSVIRFKLYDAQVPFIGHVLLSITYRADSSVYSRDPREDQVRATKCILTRMP